MHSPLARLRQTASSLRLFGWKPGAVHPAAWLLVVAILAYAGVFSYLTLVRYAAFEARALDMGNLNQAIWNTAHGNWFHFTNQPGTINRLSLHVEPIIVPIALLYRIYFTFLPPEAQTAAGPQFLVVLQSVVVALGAWPVFLLARRVLENAWLGLVFGVVFLLNPSIQAANWLEFHPVTLAPTFLLAAFYFLIMGRVGWFALFAVLAAGCKEEIGLLVFMLGFYSFLILGRLLRGWGPAIELPAQAQPARMRRVGLITMALALGWSLTAVLGIQHLFADGNIHWGRYDYLGDSPLAMVWSLISRPDLVWAQLQNAEAARYLHELWSPLGYLSLLAPHVFLLALPSLGINLLADFAPMHQVNTLIYAAPIMPFVVLSAILGAARLRVWAQAASRRLALDQGASAAYTTNLGLLWMATLGAFVLAAGLLQHRIHGYLPTGGNYRLYTITEHHRQARQILAQIPPDAAVSAQDKLNPHVSGRKTVYIFPRIAGRTGQEYSPADHAPEQPNTGQANADAVQVSTIQTDTVQVDTVQVDTVQAHALEVSSQYAYTEQVDTEHANIVQVNTAYTHIVQVNAVQTRTVQVNTFQTTNTVQDNGVQPGSTGQTDTPHPPADFVWVDVTGPAWPQHPNDLRHTIDQLLAGEYGIADGLNGYLLLARGGQSSVPPPAFYTAWQLEDWVAHLEGRDIGGHSVPVLFESAIEFGEGLRLLGYALATDPHDEIVTRLVWELDRPLDQRLAFYVAYGNEAGQTLYDTEFYPPVAQLWYPTEMWSPGVPTLVQTLPWTLDATRFGLYVGVYALPPAVDATEGGPPPELRHTPPQEGTFWPVHSTSAAVPLFEQGTLARLGGFAQDAKGRWQMVEPPAGGLVTESHPRGAVFGETLVLQGAQAYWIEEPEAGPQVVVTLDWAVHQLPETGHIDDYTVFMHLVDGSGERLAQIDDGPRDLIGPRPMSGWQVGETITDRRTFSIEAHPDLHAEAGAEQTAWRNALAAGELAVHVGVYHWQDGMRLPVVSLNARPGDAVGPDDAYSGDVPGDMVELWVEPQPGN